MKNKIRFQLLFIGCCLVFAACNTATPEKYFDVAVLNANMLNGFADIGEIRQLESPPVKAGATKDEYVNMKRTEALNNKINYLEENLKNLRSLKVTADSKDIMETSLAMYQYILPVYKTEYVQLAKLYDKDANKEEIKALADSIHNKYFIRYDELYTKLVSAGKLYATKHAIKVNWGM